MPLYQFLGFSTQDFYGKKHLNLLGEHFEEFISKKVSSGRCSSASEVVRTALRLLEAEELKIKELNKALASGEKSGFEKSFEDHRNNKNSS